MSAQENYMAQKWVKCPHCIGEFAPDYLSKHIQKEHNKKLYVTQVTTTKHNSVSPKSNAHPKPMPFPSAKTPTPSNSQLDNSQKSFCTDPSRIIRLLAPAGSGKTHSLLWRCLSLSQAAGETENVRFLVFTFTRAARDELRDRLKSNPSFKPILEFVEVATLNAWGLRRLKHV